MTETRPTVAQGWPRRLSGALLTDRAVTEHRRTDCAHYLRCLSYASAQVDSTRRGVQRWASWSCSGCPSFTMSTEVVDVRGGSGLWDDITAIDNGYAPGWESKPRERRYKPRSVRAEP
jgi:hypothetical protein